MRKVTIKVFYYHNWVEYYSLQSWSNSAVLNDGVETAMNNFTCNIRRDLRSKILHTCREWVFEEFILLHLLDFFFGTKTFFQLKSNYTFVQILADNY